MVMVCYLLLLFGVFFLTNSSLHPELPDNELLDPDVTGGGVGRHGALNFTSQETEFYDNDKDHDHSMNVDAK
jgi:hypothetical protein